MPHITVEYSSNMLERPDTASFLRKLHDALVGTGHYKMEDIKSRIVMHDQFLVANGEKDQCFAHLHLAIMPREEKVKKETSALLMDILKEYFPHSLAEKNCALSVEIRDLDKPSYIKTSGGTL
ncbi:MAG: 5-carboxymethyl-2-hydroxymuconate Delta-isomerase [Alphaproteobacteria bacterium]|nr:5-carboxymethyl-2-hydroxymuconate Delta-isomerase [Alphaproteobacteria bacterium]